MRMVITDSGQETESGGIEETGDTNLMADGVCYTLCRDLHWLSRGRLHTKQL